MIPTTSRRFARLSGLVLCWCLLAGPAAGQIDSEVEKILQDALDGYRFSSKAVGLAMAVSFADYGLWEGASGLADRFLLRGTDGVYVEFSDGESFASSLGLLAADDLLSAEVRRIVGEGRYGYEFLTVDESPTLVVGGRRPPAGGGTSASQLCQWCSSVSGIAGIPSAVHGPLLPSPSDVA